jgi:sulfonate transport system substrate-binding protein
VTWVGPFAAAAPAIEALNAGAIDITVGSSTSTVAALAAKAPIVLFTYQPMGPGAEAILVKAAGPIHRITDLIGRKVAVNRGGTGEYLLTRALETNGIAPSRVERVYLGPADAGPAFAAGAVDAMTAWDPFLSIALNAYGARVLADGAAIGSENAVVMIARRDFAARHAALLATIYRALLDTNRWSLAHPREAGLLWTRALGVPPELAPAFAARDAVPTGPATAARAAIIARVAAWYAASGIVAVAPSVSGSTLDLSGE